MVDIAERFVTEWIGEQLGTSRPKKAGSKALDDLTRRLEAAAWEFGLSRKQFLDAVKGDPFTFVLYEVEKAWAQAPQTRKGSNSAPQSPASTFA